jgi:hypothetical protein
MSSIGASGKAQAQRPSPQEKAQVVRMVCSRCARRSVRCRTRSARLPISWLRLESVRG